MRDRLAELREQAAERLDFWRERRETASSPPDKPLVTDTLRSRIAEAREERRERVTSFIQTLRDRKESDDSASGSNRWRKGDGIVSFRRSDAPAVRVPADPSPPGEPKATLRDRIESWRERRSDSSPVNSQPTLQAKPFFSRERSSPTETDGTPTRDARPTLRERIETWREQRSESGSTETPDKPRVQWFGQRRSEPAVTSVPSTPDPAPSWRDRIRSYRQAPADGASPTDGSPDGSGWVRFLRDRSRK